jgi:hypothetical protein
MLAAMRNEGPRECGEVAAQLALVGSFLLVNEFHGSSSVTIWIDFVSFNSFKELQAMSICRFR